MRRSDRGARRRRGASLALLAAASWLLGSAAGTPVRAQEAVATGEELFGSYSLEARALGIQGSYELVGLLPGGAKVLDLTLPETLARFGSGPSGYGLASVAYPGGLLVNLGSLAAQTSPDAPPIPDYPIKVEVFYPTGPTEARLDPGPGLVQNVTSNELGVDAQGAFPGVDANPAIRVGSITSASRSSIEEGKAVSRARVELGAVVILGGVVTIDSIVTDLVAVHDGITGESAGGTTATGVKFLGLDAHLDEGGLVLDQAPPVEGPGAPLGGVLDPLLEPLQDIAAPVQAALQQVLQQAVPQLDDLLAEAGVELQLISGADVESSAAGRTSSGLAITLSFEGREQQSLVDLINSIPDDLKPGLGPIPNPVNFLAENHITGLTLGHASVSALAAPPFDPDAGSDLPISDGSLVPGTFLPGTLGDPGFSTPTPDLPGRGNAAPLATETTSSPGGAIPAAVIILLLLASPFLGIGSTRLADNVLAPVATSCPSGLDQPPPPPRPS